VIRIVLVIVNEEHEIRNVTRGHHM
jgi:hypothetical protein